MADPASSIRTDEVYRHHASTHDSPSKLKTYGYAIAIIVGIGGLVGGVVGVISIISGDVTKSDEILVAAGGLVGGG